MSGSGGTISRRDFLGRAGVLASVAGSLEVLHAARKSGAPPKNIVFMVADGMSPSVLPLAEHFSQLVRGRGLLWRALIGRPEARRPCGTGSRDAANRTVRPAFC
jgi:alkaline phosphatase